MTVQEFTRDIVPIVQALLTAIGLASVILLWLQIRGTWKWNKVDAAFRCMDTDEFSRIESEALEAAKRLGVNLTSPITEEEAKKIRGDRDALLKVKSFVIFLDKQAVALMAGYVDRNVVTATWGRLMRGYGKTLMNYIKVTRVETADPEAYVELERAAEVLEAEYQKRMRSRSGDGVRAGL